MKAQPRQQKQLPQKKPRKDYDYNKPVGKCVVCYTLSGWHCDDCGNDYCQSHFYDHKEKNQCRPS
ncbi:MAG: hypothetical protein QXJ74_07205 [Nitrososphaera sp.]|uniref:hypothetical protein n=1 Tax=Nitrososphaera sp. TaxID=1971748 RepID=UPI0017D014C9|nr:hypothetical protein [Nitrososphaera sp.]NWG37145.1 hypothetical protein [Nitrososphaera sp.]